MACQDYLIHFEPSQSCSWENWSTLSKPPDEPVPTKGHHLNPDVKGIEPIKQKLTTIQTD